VTICRQDGKAWPDFFKTGALNHSATLSGWAESAAGDIQQIVRGGGKTYGRMLKSSRRTFAAGRGGRRRYAVSQNHLFAVITGKYIHFRQTALARKGLEEAKLIPAIRAIEQSSGKHLH
jgi:hypothetical protein